MLEQQPSVRRGSFDAGHRVMDEKFKCYNVHGHTYIYELHFSGEPKEIGYAIDYKEVKRVACEFIEQYFDHGFITNPKDHSMIEACEHLGSKYWEMSLNGVNEYCNPTAENIAQELYLAISYVLAAQDICLLKIILWETPNCYTTCVAENIPNNSVGNFYYKNNDILNAFVERMGIVEYDGRK